MRKKLTHLALGLALVFGTLGTSIAAETALDLSPAADAARARPGTVIAPTWWGWCGGRGRVTYMNVTQLTGRGGSWYGAGDSVSTRLEHGWQQVSVAVGCSRSFPHNVIVWIRTDRNSQKHYIGYPGGSWSN